MIREENSRLSDEELLQRYYRDHDNKWLGILLPRFSMMLFGVCLKYLKNAEDARDCVQQVFLKVIDQLANHDVLNFKNWIYMVAKNECLMRLRKEKHLRISLNEDIEGVAENDELKQLKIKKENLLNRLQENILKLKPEQQRCINYFYIEKKSYAEIAVLTGFTELQVKSYLQNGRRKLEKLMTENYPS